MLLNALYISDLLMATLRRFEGTLREFLQEQEIHFCVLGWWDVGNLFVESLQQLLRQVLDDCVDKAVDDPHSLLVLALLALPNKIHDWRREGSLSA